MLSCRIGVRLAKAIPRFLFSILTPLSLFVIVVVTGEVAVTSQCLGWNWSPSLLQASSGRLVFICSRHTGAAEESNMLVLWILNTHTDMPGVRKTPLHAYYQAQP